MTKLDGYHRMICYKCNSAWIGTKKMCPKCKSGKDVSVGIPAKY